MQRLLERTWKVWVPLGFVLFLFMALVGAATIQSSMTGGPGNLWFGIGYVVAGFVILGGVLSFLIPAAAREVEERQRKVEALLVAHGVDPSRAPQLREALQTEMVGLTRR